MSTTIERLSSNKVKIYFTVEAEKFDEGIRKAYLKNGKKITIPGFRKGRAPMKIIENFYGAGVFYEDAFEIIFPDIYGEALDEHDVNAVDRPELEVTQMERGKELIFSVEVFVRPEFELAPYVNLGIERASAEVAEDDVMAEIERARDRASRYIDVTDRPAKLDDQVNIDYEGFVDGVPFEGGKAENHDLVLGSGSFIPGFEDALVGVTAAQELDVNVTFPEQYHSEELAGKPAVFRVKVNSIHEKEMPELDDEFVKEASETADTVEDYKKEIREKLQKDADQRADTAYENEIIENIVENTEIDLPDAMVDDQIDSMLRDMEMRLMYQGMRLDDYLKYTNQSREDLRGMYKEEAGKRVRTQLVLEAIRKAENIEADDDDIEAEMEKYAENSKTSFEDFKEKLTDSDKQYFGEIAALNKTIKFLKEHAGAE